SCDRDCHRVERTVAESVVHREGDLRTVESRAYLAPVVSRRHSWVVGAEVFTLTVFVDEVVYGLRAFRAVTAEQDIDVEHIATV
ncbi:hypothetical protein E4U52_007405, partial [Claviceps spartinae]